MSESETTDLRDYMRIYSWMDIQRAVTRGFVGGILVSCLLIAAIGWVKK